MESLNLLIINFTHKNYTDFGLKKNITVFSHRDKLQN